MAKVLDFSYSISLFNEYSGLISFRIDLFDLLAVQELSRVFSNIIVQKYQFFSAKPSLWSNSHIYIWLLEKNIALTIPLFDYTGCNILLDLCSDRVFSTQSRFVIAFLPRSKLPKIITTLQEKENATFANVVALAFLLTESSILRNTCGHCCTAQQPS